MTGSIELDREEKMGQIPIMISNSSSLCYKTLSFLVSMSCLFFSVSPRLDLFPLPFPTDSMPEEPYIGSQLFPKRLKY